MASSSKESMMAAKDGRFFRFCAVDLPRLGSKVIESLITPVVHKKDSGEILRSATLETPPAPMNRPMVPLTDRHCCSRTSRTPIPWI
ncbi:hypothetical protein I7I50_03431 [Histoplasma capsulatum G186AR]|uniref:Uncharacterized protein n=1 Tax=Ajellomyces capsulatus TaxID=5037 RepID=A0A8H7YP76_AJECA|nr:hypothetical protein I7I52_04338 [Histoplasma capsulatum]QSS74580.1 hypothetical protein I7I50_03431 [Histoplasma capsulatum G186AR]